MTAYKDCLVQAYDAGWVSGAIVGFFVGVVATAAAAGVVLLAIVQ